MYAKVVAVPETAGMGRSTLSFVERFLVIWSF